MRIHTSIAEWQGRNAEIGQVQFYATESAGTHFPFQPLPPDVAFIGMFEAEAICVTACDEIVLYEHEAPNTIFLRAAVSQEAFVNALQVFLKYIDFFNSDESYGDPEEAIESRDVAICEAGGEKYRTFYHLLFGT